MAGVLKLPSRIEKDVRRTMSACRRKQRILGFGAVLLCLALMGCRVQDLREATLKVPALSNDAAYTVVTNALDTLPGREKLQVLSVDYAKHELTVRYDSMKVGTKNLEDAIAQAGLAAGPFPANPAAAAKLSPARRVTSD